MVMMNGGSTTEIIQLCEVTVLCVATATVTAVYVDKGVKSKPVPCCPAHKVLAQERADRRGQEGRQQDGAQHSSIHEISSPF